MSVLVYLLCFHYTSAHEVGICWNKVAGTLVRDQPGINVTAPWVRCAHIDTRPQRVCIDTAGNGKANCRLVQFNPAEFEAFVENEGFSYWWWANRLSFNAGHQHEYRGVNDILRGYAYEATPRNFVSVTQ